MSTDKTVPAYNFVDTVSTNVNNDKLTDAEFREFVRNSLPNVDTTDGWKEAIIACREVTSGYLRGKTNMGRHFGSYYAQEIDGALARLKR